LNHTRKPPFSGFPPGKTQFTSIPELFFTCLLSQIDTAAELKVILYIFWVLDQREGSIRYIRMSEIGSDERFMSGLAEDNESPEQELEAALQAAVQRGVLLRMDPEGDQERYFFLNTARSRSTYQAFQAGKWKPGQEKYLPVSLDLVKPNIFHLYEQNIGPLTPMIAEMLKLAEQEYPQEWLEEAVEIAVANNNRKWKYIEAILKSWQERGRDDENRRDTQTNYRRYIEGEFARYIKH
jgi:DNA replication protein